MSRDSASFLCTVSFDNSESSRPLFGRDERRLELDCRLCSRDGSLSLWPAGKFVINDILTMVALNSSSKTRANYL